MNIWLVSMECAGLAEAGGVKNVTYSLCKEFKKQKCNVTLFTPIFACTNLYNIKNLKPINIPPVKISMREIDEEVIYFSGTLIDINVEVVFIYHKSFIQKQSVYVYTKNEELKNPEDKTGTGHKDSLFLNTLLSKAVAEYGNYINKEDLPDIVHCQDASTAVTPAYIKLNNIYNKTKCVVTIHNAGPAYHHEFSDLTQAAYYTHLDYNILQSAQNNQKVEPFLIASQFGYLSTVSDDYAKEITDPNNNDTTDGLSSIFYNKNIKIKGITNGIDYSRYNPKSKKISLLPYTFDSLKGNFSGKQKCKEYLYKILTYTAEEKNNNYLKNISKYGFLKTNNVEEDIFIVYHGRIVSQKGIDLLIKTIPQIFENNKKIKFIINGQGEPYLENLLIELTNTFQGKIVFLQGYNQPCSRLVTAASDLSILPSNFEPCCLEDFIAQIYGTIPIAHYTGGLKKIINNQTGFTYSPNTQEQLFSAIINACNFIENKEILNNFLTNSANYIKNNFSWNLIIKKYLKFFKNLK